MIIGIVLAGGTGTRVGGDIPKQYYEVGNKPIISYCLNTFQEHEGIDSIIIVAATEWQEYILEWIQKEKITKFAGFALAGMSRQHSILHGMQKAQEQGAGNEDIVIIHDAARPNVSREVISTCIEALDYADGVMPVLPGKDTLYCSKDKETISGLLNRDEIFAGQAPEGFRFGKYYAINENLSDDELCQIRGTSEIAYKNNMEIRLVPGDEKNYKITTALDLEKFRQEVQA